MRGEYSKTLLRKGALKTHGGDAIPRHALRRKSGTSDEEEATLLDPGPGKGGEPPSGGAKTRWD